MTWQDIGKHVLAVVIVCASLYMAVTGTVTPNWLVIGVGAILGMYFPNSMMIFRAKAVDWQDVTKYILATAIVVSALYMARIGAVLPDWLLAAVGAVLGTFFKAAASTFLNECC